MEQTKEEHRFHKGHATKFLDVHDEFSPAQLCLLEYFDSDIPVLDVVVVGKSDTYWGIRWCCWCWQGVDDDDDAVFQTVWTQVRNIEIGDGR